MAQRAGGPADRGPSRRRRNSCMNPSVPPSLPPPALSIPSVSVPVQPQPYVKRQQDYISEDVYRCCNPDINTPFRNLQDALDRLLPYHVFHTVDEAEAEGENCKAEDGTPISKQEADKQQLLKSAVTLFKQVQKLESRIAAEEAGRLAPGKARPEEEYFLARLVADAERKEIARLQKEAQDEARRQLEERMKRDMEVRTAMAQQLLANQAQAVAMAMAATSAPPSSPAVVSPAASQPVQQPAASTQPATAPAPAESAAAEPKAEPVQEVKPEPEPVKNEPGGWSGWTDT